MYHFKITEIEANCVGRKEKIIPQKINVIIGPNNSGKSRFLKELRDMLSGESDECKIIGNLEFAWPANKEAFIERYNIENKIFKDMHNNVLLRAFSNRSNQEWDTDYSYGSYFERSYNHLPSAWKETLDDLISKKDGYNRTEFLRLFGTVVFQYLGTEDKLTICKTQKNYGLDRQQTNFLVMNKFEEETISSLAEETKKLFGTDIMMDRETLGEKLTFRVGENLEVYKYARINSQECAEKVNKISKLDDEGDGLKSFVSTYLSIKNKENDVLLLDEPESFLHPPLARRVGEIIGSLATEEKQIYIATHSVEILKGIMATCQDLNIIRITRPEGESNDIKQVDREDIIKILKTPMLRVSRVLEGLFCEKVIITEAEADEIVYQELIEKIADGNTMYFAHGQNKQSIPDIAKMYKRIGVKYVMVTDFDVFYDGFGRFKNVVSGKKKEKRDWQFVVNEVKQKIENHVYGKYSSKDLMDKEVKKQAKSEIRKIYHTQGIRWLNDNEKLKESVEKVLEELKAEGIYILPWGELEVLLEPFGIRYGSKKNHWITDALTRIGEITDDELIEKEELYTYLKGIAIY